MKTSAYLIIGNHGDDEQPDARIEQIRQSKPPLKPHQVAVCVELDLPPGIFDSVISAKVNVPAEAVEYPDIEAVANAKS
jgi:hypothetical protein